MPLMTDGSFKPYYKWIVLNTCTILRGVVIITCRFKPYYKWIVLNTYYYQYQYGRLSMF